MKKTFGLAVIGLCSTIFISSCGSYTNALANAQAKYAEKHPEKQVRLVVEEPVSSDSPIYEDNLVRFSFSWDYWSDIGLDVTIENKTQQRIYVEWENARIKDEPIVFGDDYKLFAHREKPDEVIHIGSKSKRFIARVSQVDNDGLRLFYWNTFKKYGESAICHVIIPIRFDNKTVDYKIGLKVKSGVTK